jgi:hypothetical protein
MKTVRALGLLLELLLLAVGLTTGGPVSDDVRTVALLIALIVGGLVVFCAVVLLVGLLAQRTPPFDI